MSLQSYGKKAKLVRWRHQDLTMNANTVLEELLKRLDSDELADSCVKRCWAPVPFFGDLSNSRVGTVGINPSKWEFLDGAMRELKGCKRRFHTLESLGIISWSEAKNCHKHLILGSCTKYYRGNSYERWFKPLSKVIEGTGTSYYNSDACHLDLVPYATTCKWSKLGEQQRKRLLCINRDVVGQLLANSRIEVLVLNGKTVVKGIENAFGFQLECNRMPDWSLHRNSGATISGFAYRGTVSSIKGIALNRRVLVLGYNHNIPGTPDVAKVADSIKNWIGKEYKCWIARTHL